MKKHLKHEAIKLRKGGYSYNLISKKLGIGKGTLSSWLREIKYEPNRITLERIRSGPLKSGIIRHKRRIEEIEKINREAEKEIGEISKRDLEMFGLGVYLGEGSKLYENIRITNSDPRVIKLAIKWFKEFCRLSDDNITVAMHIYPDNDEKECLEFWVKITGLSKKQFKKTQVDKRKEKSAKKRRKLPYGTIHVNIRSAGNPEFGVKLHRKIMGLIDGFLKQVEKI